MKKRSRSAYRLRLVENLEPRRLLVGDPIISEFMASNDLTLLDEDGQSSDWIELHNPSGEAVTLDGWHLTDDENDLEKWTLPNVTLGPYDYLTVFASDKDRNSLDRNLHTNFKLSADGEYLALTNPLGEVVFSFGDAFPVQSSDVSFGFQTAQFELVGATTAGKSLVPTVGDAAADWTDVDFDDSSWADSSGPIGFDSRIAIDNAGFEEGDLNHWQVFGGGVTVTDSIGISPPQGVYQGLLNGFENAKTQAQLERFLRLDAGAFDVVGGGTASKGSVMKRRFTVEAGDVIEFDWNLLTNEAEVTGNADFALFSVSPGVGGIKIGDVQQESLLSESELIRETGYQEFAYTFPESGTFTIGLGIINIEDESGESSLLLDNIRINGRGDAEGLFTDRIQTDVSDRLQNVNTSIWSRYEFDLDSTDEINSLLIRAQYDDGIAISINGQDLASQNVADAVGWNSVAESDRDESDALRFQNMFVGGAASLLRVGKNVLAVQGLTAGIDDATALFNVQLIGVGAVNEASAYFESPTPGGPNVTSNFNVADPVGFSVGHGIHDRAFELVLTTPTPGASIRYTTDGSVPSSDHGDVYDGPIAVDGTTVVRAVSLKPGLRPSAPSTQTYIFLDDTVGQSDADAISLGFPDSWGEFDPDQWPVKEADYEMDPQILSENDRYSGKYKRQIRDSLTAAPTLSLVMDVDDVFGPNGFHRDTRNRGVEWERPTSVELIYPDGTEGFQIDAGIRVQGGISRFISQKQSFRLLFKEEYGISTMNLCDQVVD